MLRRSGRLMMAANVSFTSLLLFSSRLCLRGSSRRRRWRGENYAQWDTWRNSLKLKWERPSHHPIILKTAFGHIPLSVPAPFLHRNVQKCWILPYLHEHGCPRRWLSITSKEIKAIFILSSEQMACWQTNCSLVSTHFLFSSSISSFFSLAVHPSPTGPGCGKTSASLTAGRVCTSLQIEC